MPKRGVKKRQPATGKRRPKKRAKKKLPPAAARIAEIIARLKKEYPDAKCALEHSNPLELLVATILSAQSTDALLAALERRIARNATPAPLASGAMMLQPTDERRRSGSHYTPRSLTEPIVRTALKPVLERLGDRPTPEQILESRDLQRYVNQTLARMPKAWRDAFVLHHAEGLSLGEVAAVTGQPQPEVRRHLEHAHEFLRQKIAESGLAVAA